MICRATHSEIGSAAWNREQSCSCKNCEVWHSGNHLRQHVQSLLERVKGCEFNHTEALVLIENIEARTR